MLRTDDIRYSRIFPHAFIYQNHEFKIWFHILVWFICFVIPEQRYTEISIAIEISLKSPFYACTLHIIIIKIVSEV